MKVFEALADAFRIEGVDSLFGLMGDANMAVMGVLETRDDIHVYHARDEHHAVGMADGYAQIAGTVGVASVTCGPGLTQTATALLMASRQRTPLVVLAGEAPPGHIQWMDQAPFVRACESIVERVQGPASVFRDVRRAFQTARTERKPVVLMLPLHLQGKETSDDPAMRDRWAPPAIPGAIEPNPVSIRSAADLLVRSSRPVFLAGRGAVRAGAIDQIEELAARTGGLLATSLLANGAFGGNPRYVGITGGYTFEACRGLLASADCVVAVGASLSPYTLDAGQLFPRARVVQIDSDPLALVAEDHPAEVLVVADAFAATAALADELRRRDHRSSGYDIDGSRPLYEQARTAYLAEHRWTPANASGIDPRQVVMSVDRQLPSDCIVCVGGGHFWAFPTSFVTPRRTQSWLFGLGFGSIGHGVLIGVGAAAARPDRTVVIFEGDASMLMNIGALEVAGRYNLRTLIVVLNDEALGAEYHKLAGFGLDPGLATSPSPEFVSIARAYGVEAVKVDSTDSLDTALRNVLPLQGPVLIDARITREVRSPLHVRGRPG